MENIGWQDCYRDKSQLYEALEPILNAREVELLDLPVLIEQAICLIWRGHKIDHETNSHDDWINSVAGLVNMLSGQVSEAVLCGPMLIFGDGTVIGGKAPPANVEMVSDFMGAPPRVKGSPAAPYMGGNVSVSYDGGSRRFDYPESGGW